MIILGAVGLSADLAGPISGPLSDVARAVATSGQRAADVIAANPLPSVAVVAAVALVLGAALVALARWTRPARVPGELFARSLDEVKREREEARQ